MENLNEIKNKNLDVDVIVALYNYILDIYDFIEIRKLNIIHNDDITDKNKAIEQDEQIKDYSDGIYYLRKFVKHLQIEGIIGGNVED